MVINSNSQLDIARRLADYIEYDAITTPSTFAAGAGIDASGFHKMLKGQLKITNATLKKIAGAYGLNMAWLLTGEGDTHAPKQSPVVQTLCCDDAKVSGRDMTINQPCVDGIAKEIAALRKLIENRDGQIDTLLRQLEIKDKQIQQLLDMIGAK